MVGLLLCILLSRRWISGYCETQRFTNQKLRNPIFACRSSASVTSPLISTIWYFRPYKPYIFCKDMILASSYPHMMIIILSYDDHHDVKWWSSYRQNKMIITSFKTLIRLLYGGVVRHFLLDSDKSTGTGSKPIIGLEKHGSIIKYMTWPFTNYYRDPSTFLLGLFGNFLLQALQV